MEERERRGVPRRNTGADASTEGFRILKCCVKKEEVVNDKRKNQQK